MAIPFGLGGGIAYSLYHEFHDDPSLAPISFGVYLLFIGVAMAITVRSITLVSWYPAFSLTLYRRFRSCAYPHVAQTSRHARGSDCTVSRCRKRRHKLDSAGSLRGLG